MRGPCSRRRAVVHPANTRRIRGIVLSFDRTASDGSGHDLLGVIPFRGVTSEARFALVWLLRRGIAGLCRFARGDRGYHHWGCVGGAGALFVCSQAGQRHTWPNVAPSHGAGSRSRRSTVNSYSRARGHAGYGGPQGRGAVACRRRGGPADPDPAGRRTRLLRGAVTADPLHRFEPSSGGVCHAPGTPTPYFDSVVTGHI
jgi:hypothetical protein